MIDTHCHLADVAFADDLPAVVTRAQTAGVSSARCILSADEPDEVARAASVRSEWPAVTFAAGIHPHRAGRETPLAEAAEVAGRVAREVRAVAIGEIGLDYHYDF